MNTTDLSLLSIASTAASVNYDPRVREFCDDTGQPKFLCTGTGFIHALEQGQLGATNRPSWLVHIGDVVERLLTQMRERNV